MCHSPFPLFWGLSAKWRVLKQSLVKKDLEGEIGAIDKKKAVRYSQAIAGYKKFLGAKAITWFEPPTGPWTHGNLNVSVNPELGLTYNGVPHIIKLYFKDESPTQNRVEVVFSLMSKALAGMGPNGAVVGVLDVSKGKLMTQGIVDPAVNILLQGEAVSFAEIWKHV